MIKCDKHKKDHIGACMWCGKKLCEHCIVKQEGSKYQCEKCAITLSGMRRATIPRVSDAPAQMAHQPLKRNQKIVFEDGYLVIQARE
ncbi:MAG TPA: hypothetical protein VJJ82_02945 [Candidatus Nanoarchaeia archaeon]|nr:hypothetical protein [Candidatus Nanoarchaeia archaeon]